MRKVALDLGAKKTTYCEVADGRVVQRTTVTHVESLEPLLGSEQPPATVAIEACREAWYVHDVLSSWGNQVLLVDTTRSKQLGVGRHGRKTDRIDAEVLARAVEEGRIPLAHVLTPERRELRRLLNIRRYLVEARAQGVTTARGVARESGVKLPNCDSANFSDHVRKRMKTEPQLQVVDSVLMTLDVLTEQLANVETELARLLAVEPVIQKLSTVPGVGPIVAAVFVSVVDDAKRFHRAHQLESYLGLVPGETSSGGKRRIGAITKKGNPYLRAMLVQASWSLARSASPDDPLRVWYEATAERRGKRVAVVALARKLAGVLWALWRHDTVYDPQSHGRRAERGLRSHAEQIQFQADALAQAGRKRLRSKLKREAAQPN
jgi:transposase